MKTYIKKEIINNNFLEGLHEILDNTYDKINDLFNLNKIETINNFNDNNYLQIKRLYLIYQDNKIFLNPNSCCFVPNISENIVDLSKKRICLDARDININIPIDSYQSSKYFYYKNSNSLLIICIINIPQKYPIDEIHLYTIDKIKNTFLRYMGKDTIQIYNNIIFPIIQSQKQTNIERLYNNLEILLSQNVLKDEFKVFAEENPDLNSIEHLNDIIEEEIACWEE